MRIAAILAAFTALALTNGVQAAEKRAWNDEAKHRLSAVAECIVGVSEDRTARLMQADFTSTAYESGLKRLATDNGSCWRKNRLRASYGLPFAGALSEALLKRSDTSIVARLVEASGAAVATYASLDNVSTCIVRARPGITASLLETEIGSPAEEQAIVAMSSVISDCAVAAGYERPIGNMRYLLASASYRLIAAHEIQGETDA